MQALWEYPGGGACNSQSPSGHVQCCSSCYGAVLTLLSTNGLHANSLVGPLPFRVRQLPSASEGKGQVTAFCICTGGS